MHRAQVGFRTGVHRFDVFDRRLQVDTGIGAFRALPNQAPRENVRGCPAQAMLLLEPVAPRSFAFGPGFSQQSNPLLHGLAGLVGQVLDYGLLVGHRRVDAVE